MTNREVTKIAIEYLTELRDSRQKVLPNEAPYYEAEKDMDIFNIAIKALEWQYKMQYGDCDYCKHKNYTTLKYPCTVCSNHNEMWEQSEKIEVEEPITLTDEQITDMYESGYISDKDEYKDGND